MLFKNDWVMRTIFLLENILLTLVLLALIHVYCHFKPQTKGHPTGSGVDGAGGKTYQCYNTVEFPDSRCQGTRKPIYR
jgi:hypothetical protein